MEVITADDVRALVDLQGKLSCEVARNYPFAKDLKWLTDFPRKGKISVDGICWVFYRHGSGMRFIRCSGPLRIEVDMHNYFFDPNSVDAWRLTRFLETSGRLFSDADVELAIRAMTSEGKLVDSGGGRYLYVPIQPACER